VERASYPGVERASYRPVGLIGLARSDWAAAAERVELNMHAPRCGVARACSDFEITDCVGALRRSRVGLGGHYKALTLTITCG
jgi:hypothetical protein